MARLYKDVESNQWLQSAADEKAMEVEWPCRPPRSLTLDARGKAQEGSAKIILWRTVEKEMKQMGKSWSSIQVMAKGRRMWKDYVVTLHAPPPLFTHHSCFKPSSRGRSSSDLQQSLKEL